MECTIVSEEVVEISLVQNVSAGFDAPARDANRYETLNLHTHLIERPNSSFLLEVSGESMVEAGINSGDTIVIDRSLVPRTGDIVVATLDGDFTVKYYLSLVWLVSQSISQENSHVRFFYMKISYTFV